MALVLDTTVGGAAANSYASVEQADAYHAARAFNSAWTQATVPEKARVLAWATRLMDNEVYEGSKTFSDGALRWPRIGVLDREGDFQPHLELPRELVWATAEFAFILLTEDRTEDAGGLVQYGGKVGPVTDPTVYERNVIPASVKDMISHLMVNGAGIGARGSRNSRVRRA